MTRVTLKKVTIALLGIVLPWYSWASDVEATQKINESLQSVSQDCFAFIQNKLRAHLPIVPYDLKVVLRRFELGYFAPWDAPASIITLEEIITRQKEIIADYSARALWSSQGLLFDKTFIKKITDYMGLEGFPRMQHPGIVLRHSAARTFPTNTPAFIKYPTDSADGYPFDIFQMSFLAAYEPIYVVHTTQDGAWSLVITSQQFCGWVSSLDIAYVDASFMKKWKIGAYLTPIKDGVSFYCPKSNRYINTTRVGQVLPLWKEQVDHYEVLCAESDQEGFARWYIGALPKGYGRSMPLLASEFNIALVANNLMGNPYGWGNLYGWRDCSGLLRDLFVSLGIPLAKFSRRQQEGGKVISLAGLNESQKEAVILAKAIPFLSILYMPGHVMLYLGIHNGKIHVYNAVWGRKTLTNGRAVIGRVVNMPLDVGHEHPDIDPSLIQKLTSIIMLDHSLQLP